MGISLVERKEAYADTIAFYDRSQDKFELLLNVFKALGHLPELGSKITDLVLELLKDGALDKRTKQLLVLKAMHQKKLLLQRYTA